MNIDEAKCILWLVTNSTRMMTFPPEHGQIVAKAKETIAAREKYEALQDAAETLRQAGWTVEEPPITANRLPDNAVTPGPFPSPPAYVQGEPFDEAVEAEACRTWPAYLPRFVNRYGSDVWTSDFAAHYIKTRDRLRQIVHNSDARNLPDVKQLNEDAEKAARADWFGPIFKRGTGEWTEEFAAHYAKKRDILKQKG